MAETTKLKLSKQQARYLFYFEKVKRFFEGTINIFTGLKLNKNVPGVAFRGETETS